MLKYNKDGELIGQFGVGDSQIPHSLALSEDLDLLCVADRENMRCAIILLASQSPCTIHPSFARRRANDEL